MSPTVTSSPEHCADKGLNIKKLNKKLIFGFSTFLSILSMLFFFWLILHPSKPQFYLKNTNFYQQSLFTLHLLNTTTLDINLMSKNPNTRVGIYYDKFSVYATYKGERIAKDSTLPPFYQGQEETNFLSTFMQGNDMTVSPSLSYEVCDDWISGKLLLGIKIDGQLRWKIGMWVSGRYPFDAYCSSTVISFKPGDNSGLMLSSTQGTQCSTSI